MNEQLKNDLREIASLASGIQDSAEMSHLDLDTSDDGDLKTRDDVKLDMQQDVSDLLRALKNFGFDMRI